MWTDFSFSKLIALAAFDIHQKLVKTNCNKDKG